jgi:glycosyltransferase involved in cell wall biosynthesis
MTTPKVSVVMINYNGMPWLAAAVDSVLAAETVDLELLVVDDLSRDESRGFLRDRAAGDPRLRPLMPGHNSGISGARNQGLEAARGEFVALVDSDDLFLPDTVARQLAAFERLAAREPALSLLASDAWLINEAGQRKGRYISPDWWDRDGVGEVPLWTLPSTFFFRRARAARFFEPYRSADAPLFVRRMQALGPVGFTGEPLIEYRLRMSSVTNHRGAEMVREMRAAEESRRLGRLDDPLRPEEVPQPPWREVGAWVHGRNAKNAAANGNHLRAAWETILAATAAPGKTVQKVRRSLQSRLR